MQVHMRNKHPAEASKMVFNCTKCNFKTVSEANFKVHVSEHKVQDKDGTKNAKEASKEIQT